MEVKYPSYLVYRGDNPMREELVVTNMHTDKSIMIDITTADIDIDEAR